MIGGNMPSQPLASLSAALLVMAWNTPRWVQMPGAFRPLQRAVLHFINEHTAVGLYLVIFAEELGIPLPVPGDVAIAWGGYLTTTGNMAFPLAFLAVVTGAVTGSFCLYQLSRRFGRPFILRMFKLLGIDAERLNRAEKAFSRWGPWAIIFGRHIPGLRIMLSAFAGIVEVPPLTFVLSVFVSSLAWATIFLLLGRLLGRRVVLLFRLLPPNLLPLAVLLIVLVAVAYAAHERGLLRKAARRWS